MSPSCPRCGYDLSGVAASWRETCPLEGVCSECGLGVRWAELLNSLLTVPGWSFEHAPMRRAPACWASTLIRAVRPMKFWRSVRLEHPVVKRRLVGYLLGMLILTHAVFFAVSVWMVYQDGRIWVGRGVWIRGTTLVEAAARSAWPYRLGDSWELLVGRWDRWMEFGEWRLIGFPHWFLLLWTSLTPLAFLTLSDTFRSARVRYAHLVRAGVYSFSALPLILTLHLVIGLLGQRIGTTWLAWYGLSAIGPWLPWFVFLAGVAWLVRFWWVAPRDYMRLPHAPGVSIAMLLIGGLGSLVAVMLLAIYDVRH